MEALLSKPSVLIGMSGGIDSTAACHMLLSRGYRVVGLTLITSEYSLPAADEAAKLAKNLGIEHYVADERELFNNKVIKPFVDEYLSGATPNPCINCNPEFKFNILQQWADKLGCHYIATGHYAILHELDGNIYIKAGKDSTKDQSYFLWRLTQEQLRRIIFPLGEMVKNDVRNYLGKHGFVSKSKEGESMEVCFIKGDYRDFLRTHVSPDDKRLVGGHFVDAEGKILGTHQGCPFYTIGQRKGLGIALGYPAYVTKINADKRTVMLGRVEELSTNYMLIDTPQWVGTVPGANIKVRIRYRSRPVLCTLQKETGDGRFLVHFPQEVASVTPGQFAVFYVDDYVVGGARIASQRGINQFL